MAKGFQDSEAESVRSNSKHVLSKSNARRFLHLIERIEWNQRVLKIILSLLYALFWNELSAYYISNHFFLYAIIFRFELPMKIESSLHSHCINEEGIWINWSKRCGNLFNKFNSLKAVYELIKCIILQDSRNNIKNKSFHQRIIISNESEYLIFSLRM